MEVSMSVSHVPREECEWAERHLAAALEGSRTMSTAIGLLMAERRMTRADAFVWMRSTSHNTDVPLSAIAAEIVRDFELRCS
jgi:AmiR/NasT family two-component response regulator